MRSKAWISVIISLFIFQSLWNVAAAFCLHDEPSGQAQVYHFGHHQPVHCSKEQSRASVLQSTAADVIGDEQASWTAVSDGSQLIKMMDHQDHLPSMSSVILQQLPEQLSNTDQERKFQHQFFWSNAYQSPQLSGQTPPPEMTPLSVG